MWRGASKDSQIVVEIAGSNAERYYQQPTSDLLITCTCASYPPHLVLVFGAERLRLQRGELIVDQDGSGVDHLGVATQ